jgi:arylsulfatase A-like enzyme
VTVFGRRKFLKTSAMGLAGLALDGHRSLRAGASERPNFLFVVTDDQRCDALGCAGSPVIKTPNMDLIARRGVRFERAYATTPICAASRASILTGTFERTHTYTFTKPPLSRAFTDISYPVMLRTAGYRTGFVGKFGVAVEPGVEEQMFGWREFTSLPYVQTIDGAERHMTDVEGEHALEFLRSLRQGQPFCLVWCPWAPHAEDDNPRQYIWPRACDGLYEDVRVPVPAMADPAYYDAQPEFLKNTMNRTRWAWRFDTPEKYQSMVKGYYRMISGVDMVLGRILAELERRGLDKNTIIIFTSDNGYFLGERGYAGKWLMYDLAIRIPLLICDPREPRKRPGRIRRELVLNVDLAPTIMDLAGIAIPRLAQGRSLQPLLIGRTPEWRKEIFCEELWDHPEIPRSECVRTERWKYIQYPDHPEFVELFDLEADPQEKRNLAREKDQQTRLEELRGHCRDWIENLVAARKRFS